MFRPVEPFDLVALEHDVLTRWREDDVFAESLRRREGRPEWVFYEGPPTANGRPGIHHVWARLFKDIFPRFRTMQGNYVARKGGWDCHGLPVEVEIEKELGLTSKHQIEDFGIEAFNQRCRDSVHRYVEDWGTLTSRIGMWLDTANAYWTLTNDYIETVWWLFHRMWEQGDIYEGDKVVPYCGRCGTALSSHELGQPGAYVDVTEPSVYVRFPVVDRDFDLLVWTTTPWTLISNVAAAVGPEVEYVRVRDPQGGRDLVMAAARVADVLGDAEVRRAGRGRRPRRPALRAAVHAACRSTPARTASSPPTTSPSTTARASCTSRPRSARSTARSRWPKGFRSLNPVGPDARFDATVPDVPRRSSSRTPTPRSSPTSRERGLLVARRRLHALVPALLALRDPAHLLGEADVVRGDLGAQGRPAARERERRLASRAHQARPLRRLAREQRRLGPLARPLLGHADPGVALPRPEVRRRHVRRLGRRAVEARGTRPLRRSTCTVPTSTTSSSLCPTCGGRAFRIEPVLDAWFDSGSMPVAQFHYPFENTDLFERRFPADFICEAIDQTRGWFYSLLAVNTLVFGHTPYRNVVCLGLLRRRRRPEDVEVARQRDRSARDPRDAGAPTRCAGTCSRPRRRGRRGA